MRRIMMTMILISGLLLSVTFGSTPTFVTLAEGLVPNQIKVALFVDIGRNYRGTVPAVTLSAAPQVPFGTANKSIISQLPKALTIGERIPGKVVPWLTINGEAPQQFAPDGIFVSLLETDQYSDAVSLYSKLASSPSEQRYMDIVYRQGKPIFRVLSGVYSTKTLAESARQRLLNTQSIRSFVIPEKVILVGNSRLQVGQFNIEKEAITLMNQLQQTNFSPSLNVSTDANGAPIWIVTLGETTEQSELIALRTELAKTSPFIAGQAIVIDWSTTSYLHQKELVLPNHSNSTTYQKTNLFLFNSNGQRVYVSPAADGIKVIERENRVYRGNFEITVHNKVLTLINELPYDQYLGSVVGAEMGASFPTEALRAQAVIARTYAVAQGMKYQIANVSDTTFDQAYYGVGTESTKVIEAVLATTDRLLMYGTQLVSAVYFANAGGVTATPEEVWGGTRAYYKSVQSPDQIAERGKPLWYRIQSKSGQIGYVHSDYVESTGAKNAVGFPFAKVTSNTLNVRVVPTTNAANNTPIQVLVKNDVVTVIEETTQSNSYRWIEGPVSAQTLLTTMNNRLTTDISGPLATLSVSKRGSSGRVMELMANNKVVKVSSPDAHRSLLGGLMSTLFDIDEMGRYTVLGADGKQVSYPQSKQPLHVIQGESTTSTPIVLPTSTFVIVDGKLRPRVATKEPQFRFLGRGYGHGLGLSQWGAMALAEQGYNYEQILKHYYAGVTIAR